MTEPYMPAATSPTRCGTCRMDVQASHACNLCVSVCSCESVSTFSVAKTEHDRGYDCQTQRQTERERDRERGSERPMLEGSTAPRREQRLPSLATTCIFFRERVEPEASDTVCARPAACNVMPWWAAMPSSSDQETWCLQSRPTLNRIHLRVLSSKTLKA